MAAQNSKRVAARPTSATRTSSVQPRIQPATLVSSQSYVNPGKLLVTELSFSVPLDHSNPNSGRLNIFCQSARKHETPIDPSVDRLKPLPYLVYIPGGPGFGCPPPQNMAAVTNFVLEKGYQLLCFDHRGMGLSSPITAASLAKIGNARAKANYLKLFRAIHVVKDLEAIRLCLTNEPLDHEDDSIRTRKWSIMGQSYGGFVCTTYLSFHPEGLREAFILCGLPPIFQTKADEVIMRLMQKVKQRNDVYYTKYPEDVERVKTILGYLEHFDLGLPSGGVLGRGRFLEMGLHFGFHAGIDAVHNIVLRCVRDLEFTGELSRPTLGLCERMGWFDEAPLYALLHEMVYLQGHVPGGSQWAFDRIVSQDSEFGTAGAKERYLFTGEMVFKGAFGSYAELRSMTDVMELLMEDEDWDWLYDVDQLRRNEVPVYAAVSMEDMYVDYGSSMETKGVIRGSKAMVTNMLYHDAVRSKTEEFLRSLWALRDDVLD